MSRLPCCFIALACLAIPATAQEAKPPAPPTITNAAFDRDIMRLSEITGGLAYLRDLCAAKDAGEWPKLMQQLLAAEGTTPERKGRIAGAYNNGYRNYAITYRTCTPSAQEASRRFLVENGKLTTSILRRYGN